MRKTLKLIVTTAALAGFAVAGSAQVAGPKNLNLSKESRLWIDGTSTVKSFTCTATRVDVNVVAEPGSAPADLIQSASLVVPVQSLDCKNGTMNGHMRKALKAEENPQIRWKMNSYRVDGANVVIDGLLSIAGTEKPFELRGTGTADSNGVVSLKGSTKFNMSDFGVKPPTLMLGSMKVGDPVTVSFDLVLNP